jgi:hypothetical protein
MSIIESKGVIKGCKQEQIINGWRVLALLSLGWLCSAPAHANLIEAKLVFNATGQSQWTSGAAVDFSTDGNRFLGIPGFEEGKTIGKIYEACVLGACVKGGAELGLKVNGRAGLNYDIKINNGSLTVTLPQRVSFSVPDALTIKQGGAFDIVSTLIPTTELTIYSDNLINPLYPERGRSRIIDPRLQTTGPTVQALVSAEIEAHIKAVAQYCAGYCVGPNLDEGINQTQELLALNHNGNRQLRVLGAQVFSAETRQTVNEGSLVLTAQLPTLNTDSHALPGKGFDGEFLHSGNRANVLGLTANLDKIVSDFLGLPRLNGTAGGFGYNLLTATAGLNIDVKQDFTFDPNLSATLNFTAPVLQSIDGDFTGPMTSSVTFKVGETVRLRSPTALNLGVAPVFTLDNTLRNQTSLRVDGDVHVTAGGADIYGLKLGPLVDESAGGGLATIPLFDEEFRVNMSPISIDPFNIAFALAHDTAFADTCLALNPASCKRDGLFGFNPPVCSLVAIFCEQLPDIPNQIFQLADMYNLMDTSPNGNDCVRFDAFGRPCNTSFAITTIIPELIAMGRAVRVGATSQFALDAAGSPIFLNSSVAPFLNDGLLSVILDTDEDATQRLADLGFPGIAPPFVIPAGAPVPTPEPTGVALLLVGMMGLGLREFWSRKLLRSYQCKSKKIH